LKSVGVFLLLDATGTQPEGLSDADRRWARCNAVLASS